jgi:two-component system sensor histidine kinase/response regulator
MDAKLKNAKILIIDDKQPNIDILEALLELQGYTNIESISDPRLAAGKIKSFGPDLILLDLMMPFLSGYEVMDQLKSLLPAGSYLPVLVLTADITAEAKQRALSRGAKDFLAKPYDLIEVGLRIENLLETRYLHQQLQNHNEMLENKIMERTINLQRLNNELITAKEKTEQSERELHKLNTELESRVEERTAQLEIANKELEAFTYSVSHDLKAPLRHISGFIDLLMEMDDNRRTEEETRYLKIITGAAAEMGNMISALLDFSRLNHAELRKTSIQTSVMVRQVIDFLQPDISTRNVRFNIAQLYDCEGDEQLIRQVWLNLVSNAIKYTGRKDEAVIEIGSSRHGKEIIFFIKDNGAGFDMRHSKKLFGVFQRLHKSGDFEGIGIGLANVSSIVTRHGGHCMADGKPGVGATFSFSLPAR